MMDVVRLHPGCMDCLLKKQIGRYPEDVSDEIKIKYKQRVLEILSEAKRSMFATKVISFEMQPAILLKGALTSKSCLISEMDSAR